MVIIKMRKICECSQIFRQFYIINNWTELQMGCIVSLDRLETCV